jgi:PhnB protein
MDYTGGISRRQFVASAATAMTVAVIPALAHANNPIFGTKGDEMTKLSPYLLFDGKCREAMEFYHSCLGGDLRLTRVKDSPAKDQMPAFQQEKVVNAYLSAGQVEISASDWLMPNQTPVRGNTVCMYLNCGSYEELKAHFDKLSHNAEVTDPLKDVFFGYYGALNDQFGVRWMFQANK